MHLESVTLIDEGDYIAFIDDLPFEYEGIHEITDEDALNIDWVRVEKAQVTGSIVILRVMHAQTMWHTQYRVADSVKVIVDD